ncbi:unnamed protein product [Brachionus calyciflorus]|uniref:Uncharacterized protein n=1 Tax=Brachionus calyciflorus TaxID=104777 RepID=A0A813VFN3_9BILA|nr:unnamed protein product [Brachionus calyciflorus]
MLKSEDFTFEKWTVSSLGSDMVKKFRENQYINIGQTKRIFDFVFSNLYSEKFSKIVDLNSMMENENSSLSDKNDEANQLKIKLMELCREKYQYEKSNNEKEQETNLLVKTIVQSSENYKSNTENSGILDQHLNIILIEDKLNKKKQVKSKLDKANDRLAMFLNDGGQIQSNECESLIHNFLVNLKNKMTPKKMDSLNENFNFRCANKISKISFKEFLKSFDSKLTNETNRLDHIIDEKNLQNEVDLLKYQKSKEFLISNVQSLENAIDQELLNLVVLTSQSHQFNSEIKLFNRQTDQLLKNLKNYQICKYYREYFNLNGRYFKSHITLKKIQSEFIELSSIFELLKNEKDFYRTSFLAITQNFDRIKKLEASIHEKQLELEDLHNDNLEFFNQNFQFNQNRIKISCEQLVEILRNFNSNNPFSNSTSRNDSTCFNNSKLMNQFKLLKLNLSQLSNQQQPQEILNDFKLDILIDTLGVNEFIRAKCFIFSYLLEDYLSLIKQIKLINSCDQQRLTNQEAKNLVNNMLALLNDCNEFDQNQINKYFGLLNAKSQQVIQTFKALQKIEDLVHIWKTQPGVYECPLENYTVNSKNLDYYTAYIHELISQNSRVLY